MPVANYLLDTHCLLWFQDNNPNLPDKVIKIIEDPGNIIFFSQVSLFEITIKQKIGKLPQFTANIEEIFEQAIKDGFKFLDIQNQHIYNYNTIPLNDHHRDPFDRLLIATAFTESASF